MLRPLHTRRNRRGPLLWNRNHVMKSQICGVCKWPLRNKSPGTLVFDLRGPDLLQNFAPLSRSPRSCVWNVNTVRNHGQRSSQASNSVSARYASKISRHAFILPIRYRYAIKNDRLLKLVIQKTTSYNTGQEIHDGNDGNWRRAPNQLPQCPYILRIFTAKNCRALLVLADAKVVAGTEQTAGQHAAAFSTASAVQRESVRSAAHMGTLLCTVHVQYMYMYSTV